MKVTVVRPAELGPAELETWRGFQDSDPTLANPFLAPEFTLAVAAHRPSARVAVLEDGGGIAGFLPYEVHGRMTGRAIGAGISDCQGLIHRPGLEWDPVALIRACRLSTWEYDHLLGSQRPFAGHHTHWRGSPIIDLTAGYDAYLAAQNRTTNQLRQALRKQRKLERDLGEVRFYWDDRTPAALETLTRWKSTQYHRTGQYDRFGTPWIASVVHDLLDSTSPGCRALVSVLYASSRPVAAHLGLRSRSVLAYWFPAYDAELAPYSAGMALCIRLAEAAARDGISHIDLGKGESRYKDALKNRELAVCEGVVARWAPIGTARRARRITSERLRRGRLGRALRAGPVGDLVRAVRAGAHH